MDEALRAELERMGEADQAIRVEAMRVVQEDGMGSAAYAALRARGREMQGRNAARLAEIVAEHGWPGRRLVGGRAASGAFLALQHADLALQQRLLPVLREAAAAGETDPRDLPLLEDRVRLQEGRPQIYGTQVTRGADGQPTLWPIEDEAHVDERRARAGLEPLEAYLARLGLARHGAGPG